MTSSARLHPCRELHSSPQKTLPWNARKEFSIGGIRTRVRLYDFQVFMAMTYKIHEAAILAMECRHLAILILCFCMHMLYGMLACRSEIERHALP